MIPKLYKNARYLLMTVLFGGASLLYANNIQVSNVALTGQNSTEDYTFIQFDLSWENSWRTSSAPFNWDAAWVFVKYRITAANGGDDLWKHALLNDAGHCAGTGTPATLDAGLLTPGAAFNSATNPGLGAFVYRSADGTGPFSATGIQLRWNYGANSVADGAITDVQVFAIEMVFIATGPFYLGSGGTEVSSFYTYPSSSSPYLVNGEQALSIGAVNGNLYYNAGGISGDQTGPVPASFPKGYAGFYCQKYEITQQQYVNFLNTLTQTQANNRKHTSVSNRYAISGNTIGNYSTSFTYVACNFLSWMDGAAYADWAALRPMTELEYEKACRGILAPVPNEYSWGNSTATAATNIINYGTSSETTNTLNANAVFGSQANVLCPLRVGAFSNNVTIRNEAGAGFWGIVELSGNLWEWVVTIGNNTGRSFTSIHGDGSISLNGFGNISGWPGFSAGEITGATGAGVKGGGWTSNINSLRISDREYVAEAPLDRGSHRGFRAVRSIPFVCGESELAVNHVAGTVAPVNKGVSYGTVTNIPGEPTKCWITKNLGATQQATTGNESTESSAGWYWQFNRKRGYKHEGISPSPTWTITYINESSNWVASNDPCTIELGDSWRIPTYTEWNNVDLPSGGNWYDWNGPWNSALKLHAAGSLNNGDGSLIGRGSTGRYWSSSQSSMDYGFVLGFWNSNCTMENGANKAGGYTIRCIKD